MVGSAPMAARNPAAPAQDYRVVLAKGIRRGVAQALGPAEGGVPARRMEAAKFDALMAELFRVAGSTFAGLAEKDPPQRTIACKEGCAYCCHLYVQVTPLEAIRIARVLQASLDAPALAAMKETIAAAHARAQGKDAADRMVLALPCPLLQDGRCSVYEDRPFVCRGANSADVDACRAGLGNPNGAPLPMYIHQRNVYASVGQGTAEGIRDAGYGTNLVELIAALNLALEHDDQLAAWQTGALDFAPARCLEAVARPRF